MNHCIPNRVLRPVGAEIYNGFVVTTALAGNISFYVFRDKDNQLYRMPNYLFKCENPRGMKNTQILRFEKMLEFGDNIYFTANEESRIILDYEKSLKVHETACTNHLNLVRTICVLPKQDSVCWSELFGEIELNMEDYTALRLQAMWDVPCYAWVSIEIEYETLWLVARFYEFIEVAVDERKIVWETRWNVHRTNKPTTSFKWDTSDDDDDEEVVPDFVQKKENQILDVKLKLEGVLIGQKEIFCAELKDYQVMIGLWEKHLAKFENLPLGHKFRFDAYFSDIHQHYIAYFYEQLTVSTAGAGEEEGIDERVCEVLADDLGTLDVLDNKLIQIPLLLTDTYGWLYNNMEFGLISDPNCVLGPLSYNFDILEVDEIWVNVVDTGAGKKLSRFKIECLEDQPEETIELIEKADELTQREDGNRNTDEAGIVCLDKQKGILVDAKGTFYCPKYATQFFDFPKEEIRNFPTGYWIEFDAKFIPGERVHKIVGGRLVDGKELIPHTKKELIIDGRRTIKYQFKIDVECVCVNNPNNAFLNGQLYNPQFGLINDPEGRFEKKRRIKKYKLIVEAETESSLHLFRLVRMAEPNERMESEKKGKNEAIPYNEDPLGLEGDDEFDEADGEPKSQAEYLAEYAVRERKTEARERRRDRDRKLKQLLEENKQLEQEMEFPTTSKNNHLSEPKEI